MNKQEMGKLLNTMVTGNKFVDKDTNDYLYASLSQPPIKIIDKCGSDNEMDYIVECPNCGSHVNYGKHTFMNSGYIYCDTGNCRDNLMRKLGKVMNND